MTDLYDQDDVRVVGGERAFRSPAASPDRKPDEPARSRAQDRLDAILRDAEDELREARDLVARALEDLALVLEPQHPNLPTLLGQQIEQVIQFRATSSKVSR